MAITVSTQSQYDQLAGLDPAAIVEIWSSEIIQINEAPSCRVAVRGTSAVIVRAGRVRARDHSKVVATGTAVVEVCGSAVVVALENSIVIPLAEKRSVIQDPAGPLAVVLDDAGIQPTTLPVRVIYRNRFGVEGRSIAAATIECDSDSNLNEKEEEPTKL